jgi:hypothetical protein
MKHSRLIFGTAIAAVVVGFSAVFAADLSLTIYSQNYSIVRETDTVTLPAGESEIRHEVITKFLLDEPVRFSGQGVQLLEQRYEYDVPTLEYLLEKNVGKLIELILIPDTRLTPEMRPVTAIRGTLLSDLSGKDSRLGDRILLKDADGTIRTILRSDIENYHFVSPPEDLTEDPTLVWKVDAHEAGPHKIEATYEVLGLAWKADYILDLAKNDSTADFSCWVSVDNATGKTLNDVDLNLVDGAPIRRSNGLRIRQGRVEMAMAPGFKTDADGGLHFRGGRSTESLVKVDGQSFRDPISSSTSVDRLVSLSGLNVEEVDVMNGGNASQGGYQSAMISRATAERLFQMHLYRLPHKVDLKNESVTEISLIPQTEIQLKTYYDYVPRQAPNEIGVYVELTNADSLGLGIPLPPGELKIYRMSEVGTPEFVAEDRMQYLAEDAKQRVRVGQASDIKVARTRTDYIQHSDRKFDETWEIKLENQKETPVDVTIRDSFPYEYKIIESTHPWKESTSHLAELPLTIEPGKEVVITYKVRLVMDNPKPDNE